MFSDLLASGTTLLAALLQMLKPPIKYVRIFVFALIFICIGSLIMMCAMKKHILVREEPELSANNSIKREKPARPAINSINDLSIVREESLKETLSTLNELFGVSDFEIMEETYYRIKIEIWVRK